MRRWGRLPGWSFLKEPGLKMISLLICNNSWNPLPTSFFLSRVHHHRDSSWAQAKGGLEKSCLPFCDPTSAVWLWAVVPYRALGFLISQTGGNTAAQGNRAWARALKTEPVNTCSFSSPLLILPFPPRRSWNFSLHPPEFKNIRWILASSPVPSCRNSPPWVPGPYLAGRGPGWHHIHSPSLAFRPWACCGGPWPSLLSSLPWVNLRTMRWSQFPRDCTYFLKEHVGFPGSPVVRQSSQWSDQGSIPGWGTRPHRPQECACWN